MGYPIDQGTFPKIRQWCTNFASVFINFSCSSPLYHCSNIHPQRGKQFHTNLFCGVEHGPRGIVWERKFVIKQKQKVSVSFTIPLCFTTKQAWRDICHSILLSSYVKRRQQRCYNMSANAHSNCPATTNISDANRSTHETVGSLLINTHLQGPQTSFHTLPPSQSIVTRVQPFPNLSF